MPRAAQHLVTHRICKSRRLLSHCSVQCVSKSLTLTPRSVIFMTSSLKKPSTSVEHAYSTSARTLTRWLGCAAVCALTGCPTYDDQHSGTFVEVRDNALSEEVLAIDFFRFGYYSNAIVRRYRAPQSASPDTLLDNQISCSWTETGGAPDEEANSWRLDLERSDASLSGVFTDQDTLTIEIEEPDASGTITTTTKTLRRFRDRPNNVCDVIRPLPLQARFDLPGDTPNTMPAGTNYTLRQPTFAMLWAGVTPTTQGNTTVWAAKNDLVNEVPLTGSNYLDRERGELKSALSFSVTPPPDRALARSGSTRYALAHFVVIDDDCANPDCTPEKDSSFRWDVDDEPIIATSLQRGNEVDSPVEEATGLGKALLFVEGSLDDLDPDFRSLITHIDLYTGRRTRAHFYVVDIFYDDSASILGIRLPPDPDLLARQDYRRATLKLSNSYLNNTQIPLPRLLPLALF